MSRTNNIFTLWEIITKGIKYRWASLEVMTCLWATTEHEWQSEREDYLNGKK